MTLRGGRKVLSPLLFDRSITILGEKRMKAVQAKEGTKNKALTKKAAAARRMIEGAHAKNYSIARLVRPGLKSGRHLLGSQRLSTQKLSDRLVQELLVFGVAGSARCVPPQRRDRHQGCSRNESRLIA